MNETLLYDQQHNLLVLLKGIPQKFKLYKIPGATGYHVKVNDDGYMLFQHIQGKYFEIWISNYLFNKTTTLHCQAKCEGVEFHNILEGSVLYQLNGRPWQHLKAGEHNVLYNPIIKSTAIFNETPLTTFDVHLTPANFKSLIEQQHVLENWLEYVNSGMEVSLYPASVPTPLSMQGLIVEMIEKCSHSLDIDGSADALLEDYLKKATSGNMEKCRYRYSFEEIKTLLRLKEVISRSQFKAIILADVHKESLMGQKKFSEGFKLLFGIVPSQFILKEKIKTCKSLLVKEEILTNEDIANIMEFSTGSHFATTFKRFEGCTPQEFRRKMLNRVS